MIVIEIWITEKPRFVWGQVLFNREGARGSVHNQITGTWEHQLSGSGSILWFDRRISSDNVRWDVWRLTSNTILFVRYTVLLNLSSLCIFSPDKNSNLSWSLTLIANHLSSHLRFLHKLVSSAAVSPRVRCSVNRSSYITTTIEKRTVTYRSSK
jgi:hypothetical protein